MSQGSTVAVAPSGRVPTSRKADPPAVALAPRPPSGRTQDARRPVLEGPRESGRGVARAPAVPPAPGYPRGGDPLRPRRQGPRPARLLTPRSAAKTNHAPRRRHLDEPALGPPLCLSAASTGARPRPPAGAPSPLRLASRPGASGAGLGPLASWASAGARAASVARPLSRARPRASGTGGEGRGGGRRERRGVEGERRARGRGPRVGQEEDALATGTTAGVARPGQAARPPTATTWTGTSLTGRSPSRRRTTTPTT